MLSRYKMTFTEIREAILKVDDSVLTEQMIAQFLKFVPSTEEVSALQSCDDSVKLAKADLFLQEVGLTRICVGLRG